MNLSYFHAPNYVNVNKKKNMDINVHIMDIFNRIIKLKIKLNEYINVYTS